MIAALEAERQGADWRHDVPRAFAAQVVSTARWASIELEFLLGLRSAGVADGAWAVGHRMQ